MKNIFKLMVSISFIFFLLTCNEYFKSNTIESSLYDKDSKLISIYTELTENPSAGKSDKLGKEDFIKFLKRESDGVKLNKVILSVNKSEKINLDIYNFCHEKSDFIKIREGVDYNIREYSYKKLVLREVEGSYVVSGKNSSDFISKLNKYPFIKCYEMNKDNFFSSSQYDDLLILYYFMLLSCTVLLLFNIYSSVNHKSKQIHVYNILGYSFGKMIYKFNIRDCIISCMQVLIISIITVLYRVLRYSFDFEYILFVFLMTLIFIMIYVVSSVAIVYLFILYSVRLKKNFILSNKGIVNTIVLSFLTTISIIVVCGLVLSIGKYKENYSLYKDLTEINDYADISTYFESDSTEDEERLLDSFNHKHVKLYELSDKKGGILLYPGNTHLGVIDFPKAPYISDTVIVNNNYLNKVKIKDIRGNRIKGIRNDKYTITVLVPEKYKKYDEKLKEFIHSEHIFRFTEGYSRHNKINDSINISENDNISKYDVYMRSNKIYNSIVGKYLKNRKIELKENIIYIDNEQKFLSFSRNFPIDSNGKFMGYYIKSPIAFIINSLNYVDDDVLYSDLGGSIYYSSIGNGYMHSKIDDYDDPIKSISGLLKESGLHQNKYFVKTIGDTVNFDLNREKNYIASYSLLMIILVPYIIGLIKTDINIYIEQNRKKIGIKHFLGFGKIKIFNVFLLKYVVKNILSAIYIYVLWSMFYLEIKNRYYFDMNPTPLIAICVICIAIEGGYILSRIKRIKINYIDIK